MPAAWEMYNRPWVLTRVRLLVPQDEQLVDDTIDLLLVNPMGPTGVFVHRQRGVNPDDLWIAHFPNDWYLTYTIHPGGIPPLGGPLVMARSVKQMRIVPS